MDLNALFKLSYGMYVVSSKAGGGFNGQIANTVFQVTAEPPAIAVCINKQNLTYDCISKSRVFTVSVLSTEASMEFIGKFGFRGGRDIDKFKATGHRIGVTGAPIVTDYTLAFAEAELTGTMDVGTHVLFVGRVVAAEIIAEGEPMTYAYYHAVKRGKAPATAPTYRKEEKKIEKKAEGVRTMKKYKCTVCGYVYDPEKGDPASGIPPGTPFEKLPDSWVCPVCGAPKSAFEPLE